MLIIDEMQRYNRSVPHFIDEYNQPKSIIIYEDMSGNEGRSLDSGVSQLIFTMNLKYS